MRNEDIPYKSLSRDYERLYELMKEGSKFAAYMAISDLDDNPSKNRSSLVHLRCFNFPLFVLGSHDVEFEDLEPFVAFCEKYNVQYFDISQPNKNHYEALNDCANSILDALDENEAPVVGINGLRILLNRVNQ